MFIFMHISVLLMCMHVHQVHTVPEQVRPREGLDFLE